MIPRRETTIRFAVLVLVAACGGRHGGKGGGTSCDATADHVLALLKKAHSSGSNDGSRDRGIRDVFAARCKADAWAIESRTCILNKTAVSDDAHCKDKLTAAQRTSLDVALAEEEERARLAHLPQACTRYKDTIDKLQKCDKVKSVTREAMKAAFDQTIASKGGDLEERCKAGQRNAEQSFGQTCGW